MTFKDNTLCDQPWDTKAISIHTSLKPADQTHNPTYHRLKESNKMQLYAEFYLLLKYTTNRPNQSLFGHIWRSLLPRQYDLYHRLLLQFYVLLMTGVTDARNM